MASRAHTEGRAAALPLHVALSVIPSLPRALLARLVERAIERLDEIDGDAELEPDDPPELAWMEWDQPRGGFFLNTQSEDDEDGHDREAVDEREPDDDAGEGEWPLADQRIAVSIHGGPWHIDRDQQL